MTPNPWGEFDLDCTTNEVIGVREALVSELTRAYARNAPGRLTITDYDHDTGTFQAAGTDAPTGTRLIAFYPASKHGSPTLTATGLDTLRTIDAPGGNAYILATTAGSDWSLNATAPGE